jgi:hypothetical protein
MFRTCIAIVTVLGLSISAQAATTYTYNGPSFAGGTDHVSVSFTTAAPLGPSTSYISQTAAGVTASSVSVVGPKGPLLGFTLPVTTFQVHTDAAGAIDSWFIFGDFNTLVGTAPTMTGTDWQAYTMNTLAFIPGSDIAGAVGLVTGHYDYDQATETTFYTTCSGAPAGCTLAGNGQPYVGNYSGIINPSNTTGSWWSVSTTTVAPLPTPVAPVAIVISGTLPNGQLGVAYTASLTATGGTAPYTWSATGLPAGLTINNGTVSGTPTASGTFSVAVTVTDATGAVAHASYSMAVNLAVCSNTNAVITSVGRNFIVVNGGLNLADHVWYTPTSAGTTFTGGVTSFATGELVDYVGQLDPVSGCYATSMTVKPTPTVSCTKPAGTKARQGRGIVTAVGVNFIQVKTTRIDYAACTSMNYGGSATTPTVGDLVEWEGFRETNGNVMAQTLSFN